jgi:hypothetical protein
MDQPTYLNEKSEGDHSMSEKRETGEAFTPREVPQGPHTMVRVPSLHPTDPDYRRLRYIRYADLCRARHKSASSTGAVVVSTVRSG